MVAGEQGGENGGYCLMGTEFQFGKMNMETGGGDGCTVM